MKCLSLAPTFVTDSESGRNAWRKVSGALIEATHKGSFHARLDTSVTGHGAGFYWPFNKITHGTRPRGEDEPGNKISLDYFQL